jgi:hypothetical protein
MQAWRIEDEKDRRELSQGFVKLFLDRSVLLAACGSQSLPSGAWAYGQGAGSESAAPLLIVHEWRSRTSIHAAETPASHGRKIFGKDFKYALANTGGG